MTIFQLIDDRTNEVVMCSDSTKACRVYAVKLEHAKAIKFKIESTIKICQKTNHIKNFYRLGLDKYYSIIKLPQPKIYTMSEVHDITWMELYNKIYKKT